MKDLLDIYEDMVEILLMISMKDPLDIYEDMVEILLMI